MAPNDCGADMWFVETPSGRQMPVERDGTPHHSTCPKAEDFRR